jgi:uncharacterized protein (TIGR02246 family)
MTPAEAVLQFIEAINTQDVELLVELMTPDHVFVDSSGREVRGRDKLREPWQEYFRSIPDYQVTVDETVASGSTVVVLGLASGTCEIDGNMTPENRWQIPSAWRARVKGGRISEWQVYADQAPVREILGRRSALVSAADIDETG